MLGLALAFYVAWSIGSNDAANPTSTAVGGGALSIKKAIALFSAFAFLGSVIQGWMVIKTFGGGIAEIETVFDALAASMATAFWIIMSSWKGLPISTTHSSVGAVLGVALARCLTKGYTGINYGVLVKVVLSWITSPIGAALLAAGLYVVIRCIFVRVSDDVYREKFLKALLIAGLAYSAYAFGANDVGNATGVYVAVVKAGGIATEFDYRTAIGLSMLGAAGIALGGFTLGPRVIRTVAFRITRLDMMMAAAAVIANASVVWVYTTIPTMLWGYGMPISTTHASVSAVLGVGMAKHGVKGVNWSMMLKIMLSWLLTVPAAAGIAIVFRLIMYSLTGIS